MKWWEISLFMICTSFIHYVYIKSCSLIYKEEIRKIDIKMFLGILIITVGNYYNTFNNYGFSKIIISFLLIFLLLKISFNDNNKSSFIKALLIYAIVWIYEIIIGILFIYFSYSGLKQINNDVVFKVLLSTLIMLFVYLSSYIKKVRKIFNIIYSNAIKTTNLTTLIILFITIVALLTFYLIINTDVFSNITIIFLLVILTFLFVLLIVQSIKTKKADEKQEILLDFMKEYEIIIDKERIDRHEMVNNLLVLKSIKDKNSKEYEKILNDILLSYKSTKNINYLYDLPSGLKGILYYKIYDMEAKNINVIVNISNDVINYLENLPIKSLTKLCKIIGILLDNAKEASEKSKIKETVIDIYSEYESIIVYVENTMVNNNINISKIKEKGYSTKGKNRGYGLFLVEKLLNESNKIQLEQKIENERFISIIKIKK